MKKTLIIILTFQAIILQKSQAQNFTHLSLLKDSIFLPLKPAGIAQLPANYYSAHLPFVCEKELKMEKLTGLPLKLRLGSISYTDKLEGKNLPLAGLH